MLKLIPTEAQVQRAVFQHVRIRAVRDVVIWHTPNGGYRPHIVGAQLQGQGTLAGIPDVLALRTGHLYGLELKRDQGGRLTAEQKDTLAALERAGAIVAVAHGLDEAFDRLRSWGLLR